MAAEARQQSSADALLLREVVSCKVVKKVGQDPGSKPGLCVRDVGFEGEEFALVTRGVEAIGGCV